MKRLMCLVIGCAALFGCTANSDEPEPSSSLSAECYSRKTEFSEAFPIKDFAMFVMKGDQPYGDVSNPIHVTYGSTWTFPDVKLTEAIGTATAFSPFVSQSSYECIPMDISSQTDYMVSASYEVSNVSPTVTFQMEHLLAGIDVIVEGSRDVKVRASIKTTANYSIKNRQISSVAGTKEVATNGRLLVFPEYTSLSLTITHQGKEYEYLTPYIDFNSGKVYTFNLEVDDSLNLQIVGDVGIMDWQQGGDYSGIVKP